MFVFYPFAYVYDASDNSYLVVVPGVNVNGEGDTREEALTDAATISHDVLNDLAASGEAVPAAANTVGEWFKGQTVNVLQATVPAPVAACGARPLMA